ncbi:MAG TPA: ABC transporter substrate-binding protein [Candidatus Dormibacteraeota bacterium]|nr:ABC transporter substrate-binding protein [Candidatus Dormibacteraeota bacterium]
MRLRLLIAILVLIAAACGDSSQSANPAGTITIGAIYPLSGPQAPGGKDELGGVQSALQLAQAQGVLGHRVQLRIIDATTPDQASAAVDQLVQQDHVPAILGTYGSTLAVAASARAEELKTVYWETGAVADPITAQRHYVFRTVATGSSLGRMAVTFTHDVLIPASGLTSPRVVIVHVNDIYGESVGGGELALAQQLGINVVDTIAYNPNAFDTYALAGRIADDRPDFLWDVSYIDDGVAIWQAIVSRHIPIKAAVGTSSAFCMPEFGRRLGAQAIGVYAADKPDATISQAALSPAGRKLLAEAQSAYERYNHAAMSIPAVAGFVGAWTLLHDVLPNISGAITPDSIRAAALKVDVPTGDSINGGGVRFGADGTLDEGQNTRAAAVVGQWQAVEDMRVVYPAAYATAKPILH